MSLFSSKKDPLSQYQDPTGDFSNRELKMASWYVRRKELLRHIVIGVLSFFCIVTVGYSGYRWVEYAFFGSLMDRQMYARQVAEIQNYTRLQPLYRAVDLEIRGISVFTGEGGKYDIATRVSNPNARYVARVQFRYVLQGIQTDMQESVILPEEERLFLSLGQKSDVYPGTPRLEVVHIEWIYLNPHRFPDPALYLDQHLRFPTSNLGFTQGETGENDRLKFDIKNDTIYGFWDPAFYLELYDGNRLVGIRPLNLGEFRSQDTRHIDLHFVQDISSVSRVVLVPAFDPFDRGVYIPIGV